jgi:hypothetical protein
MAGGYRVTTDNLCNYSFGWGRESSFDANGDYSGLFGFQNAINANYSFATGRGHTVAVAGGVALGLFSKYTDGSRLFQYGIGTSSSARKNAFGVAAAGNVEILAPSTGTDPGQNEEVTFRRVDDTHLKVVLRGADATVRSANIPVSTAGVGLADKGQLIGVQTFTASGTYTPTAGTNSIVVEVQAPGGGSGGIAAVTATGSTFYALAGAGGGGGWGRKRITASFSGTTVTVGAQGAGGAAGANPGTAGGTTSFGAFLSCTGGGGGAGDTPTANSGGYLRTYPTAGSGGVATGADVSCPGGGGQVGVAQANNVTPGFGGSSMYGAGATGYGPTSATAGLGFGGGAKGAEYTSASTTAAIAGAAGAPGIVIVWEYA